MYEKFRTQRKHLISDKLYFDGSWFLEKEIISTWCFHPLFKKLVNLKIHIGELYPEKYEIVDKEYKDGSFVETKDVISLEERLKSKQEYFQDEITDIDFEEELKTYLPNPSEDKRFYVYIECFRKSIKLPDYYSLTLFNNDLEFENCSINRANSYILNYFVPEGKFENIALEKFIEDCFIAQGLAILQRLNKLYQAYYLKNELNISQIRNCQNEVNVCKENISYIYQYSLNAVDSIINELCSNKIAMVCQRCNQVMTYAKSKKYCSLNKDGQDCGKKARNARCYINSKIK